ncbi:LOW QUALITY PROTEIN: nucleoporin p58/p45 [Cyprinus carpio]|uniref:LOW QUALITY PROTEIN: nucleoporin p58/p45 n=1 Tax=Cyprinus carpio TaxID=7962 RepID=A0A9Q9VT99_CYPCA|nr:LOW QUALITY PROTEIN: nucleoporin p58/p45 [Cyprinus carpio]
MSGFNFGSSTLGSTGTGGGFSLGAATSAPAAGTGGFGFGGFGTPTSTPAATSTTSKKPATGFTFNTPAASGAAASTTGLTLGSLTTSTAASTGFSLGFGKPAASATPFSLTATTSAATGTGLTLGSILTSTAPQTSSTGFSLNLGGAATTSSAPASGFSFGSSLFSNPSLTGLGQSTLGGPLSLGGLVSTSIATTSAPAPSLGLGGVDFSTSSEKNTDKLSSTRPEDSKALKDENLPGPICQDVDNFQKFVKEQKQVQEEISRMSSKAILKVQEDIKTLRQLLSVCASGLQRNSLSIDKLKLETSQELKNADIALRTQKTPPGLQHENTCSSTCKNLYFRALVEQFEVQLQQYRQQIEELENHLTTQSTTSPHNPSDLSQAMQKLYQTFVALAAQLQGVHENVKTLKHQYLGYRRAFLDDSTDIFESKRVAGKKWQSSPNVTTGPAPFGSVPNAAAVAMAATLTQQQQPAPGPQAPLGASFGTPFSSGIGTSMGSSSLGAFRSGPGFGGVATGGLSFGFSSSKPSGGSLSAGVFVSNTSGFNFSNPGINASAGLTFGVSNTQTPGFGTGSARMTIAASKKPPENKKGKR